jgi:hypothetical protein
MLCANYVCYTFFFSHTFSSSITTNCEELAFDELRTLSCALKLHPLLAAFLSFELGSHADRVVGLRYPRRDLPCLQDLFLYRRCTLHYSLQGPTVRLTDIIDFQVSYFVLIFDWISNLNNEYSMIIRRKNASETKKFLSFKPVFLASRSVESLKACICLRASADYMDGLDT